MEIEKGITWIEDLEEAKRAAKRSGKPLDDKGVGMVEGKYRERADGCINAMHIFKHPHFPQTC